MWRHEGVAVPGQDIYIYIYHKYMVSLAISSNSLQENKQVDFSNYSF